MKVISLFFVCLLLGACGEAMPVKSGSDSAYQKVAYKPDVQSQTHQKVMDDWVADQMQIR